MQEKWKERLAFTGEVLKIIAGGAIVVAALIAPNIAQLLPAFGLLEDRRKPRWHQTQRLSRAIRRLKRSGDVALIKTQNGFALRLTEQGSARLARYQLHGIMKKKPRRWDKIWRFVIFDVKETRKYAREAIRNQLRDWSFFRFQDSVWVYPYPCEEAIELLKTAYRGRYEIFYLEVRKLSYDQQLRKRFGFD